VWPLGCKNHLGSEDHGDCLGMAQRARCADWGSGHRSDGSPGLRDSTARAAVSKQNRCPAVARVSHGAKVDRHDHGGSTLCRISDLDLALGPSPARHCLGPRASRGVTAGTRPLRPPLCVLGRQSQSRTAIATSHVGALHLSPVPIHPPAWPAGRWWRGLRAGRPHPWACERSSCGH
jgi:hypothetical protein